MEYTNYDLYKISKKVYSEAMLHSQLQAAGSNKAKFLEKIQKNRNSAGVQSIVMKILVTVYIIIFTVLPVTSFMQINIVSGIPLVEDTWNLFAGGLSISAFMLLQPIILIIFSVTFTWGFLSKEPYTWVSTLPFSRREISKISFFTFFRGIDIQLIVMALVLPIGTMIGINLPRGMGVSLAKNLIMVFTCIIVNLANTVFNISIVILLGRKMAKIMDEQEENTKMSNFIRIMTILAYFIFSMVASYTIQIAIANIPRLYDPANQFISTETTDIINKILCFIPFPFAGGYLLTCITLGLNKIPLLVLIGSIIGSILQIGLAILVFRKALQILQDITSMKPKAKQKRKSKEPSVIEIIIRKPVAAYLRRDLALITREMQTITFLIMPIMIPISTALAYPLNEVIGSTGIPAMVVYIFSFAIFNTFFIIIGITSIETGGETITSSLPINTRDQFKAKIPFLFSIVPLMVMLSVLIQIKKTLFIDILILSVVLLPAIFILAITGLLLKVIFFGKFKYKFVLDEVNTTLKELKFISIILIMFVIGASFVFSLFIGIWLTLVLEGISLIFLFIIFSVIFPKNKHETNKILG